jgi:hypothetical protein
MIVGQVLPRCWVPHQLARRWFERSSSVPSTGQEFSRRHDSLMRTRVTDPRPVQAGGAGSVTVKAYACVYEKAPHGPPVTGWPLREPYAERWRKQHKK